MEEGKTTIGIPWATVVTPALHLIGERLQGSTASARLISLAHEPVMRRTV